MRPIETLTIGDARPRGSTRRQLILYFVLPSLPLLLFFLLWRIALANTGIVLQSATSPDGAYMAELIRRDPGGDASYDYYVRLRKTSSRIVDPLLGNTYRAFDQGSAVGQVRLTWTGPSSLTIGCTGCVGYKVSGDSWRGVLLRYEMHPALKQPKLK